MESKHEIENQSTFDEVSVKPTNNTTLFSKETMLSSGANIKLSDTDEDNKLELYCYVKCESTDSDILKQSRGVVFNGDKIILKTFPYTTEFNHKEVDKITETLKDVFNDCVFYEAEEGTLIRMFFYNDRWYTLTHRKLNAFRSKWASKDSFGTLFKNALEYEISTNSKLKNSINMNSDKGILDNFQSILDKNKQYVFLLRNNNENRIVCFEPPHPTVFHIGTFENGVLNLEDNINIPRPKQLNFKSVEEACDYAKNVNIKNTQGVIVFAPNNVQYKILNEGYQELFNVRGNEPSIKYRYLQVRMDKKLTDMLYYLYPDKASIFDTYEDTLYDIACKIFKDYKSRFINKEYITVPQEEFNVIRECHAYYLNDRVNNRVNLDTIINFLNTQKPTNINKMIRRFEQDVRKLKAVPEIVNKKMLPITEPVAPL